MAGAERGDSPNVVTLASLGIIAYVAETLLHELVGHSTICLLTGGSVGLVTPLYMQCSVQSPFMVAAGPGMNVLTGLLCFLALRIPATRTHPWRYLLWLSFAFNWLVAAGYLLVGAITGFGDWGVLFRDVEPSWLWRAPAAIVAVVAYGTTMTLASRALVRITGIVHPQWRLRAELIVLPTAAAAVVAVAAQLYGQGPDPLGLALALGCTLVVGLSLAWAFDGRKAVPMGATLWIDFSLAWLIVAALTAVIFVFFVGPGLRLPPL